MIFIGVMFFKVPSGLCIYFITSSLWGIAERKLVPKPELKGPRPGGGGKGGGEGGQPGSNGPDVSKAAMVARERARQRRKDRKK